MSSNNRKNYHFFLDGNNPLQKSAMEQIESCKQILGCTTKSAIVTLLCNKNIIIEDKNNVIAKLLEELHSTAATAASQSASTVVHENNEAALKTSDIPAPAIKEDKGTITPPLTVKEEVKEPQKEVEQPKKNKDVNDRLQKLVHGQYV